MKKILVDGELISFEQAKVMGILNLTPDSFYQESRVLTVDNCLKRVDRMIEQGLDILDVGAASTRPGASIISAEKEWERMEKYLVEIKKYHPKLLISVDTYNASTARKAVENGANIINDISAGNVDNAMFDVVAELKVPYILMHMQGDPNSMQSAPYYKNVQMEVLNFFSEKIAKLNRLGVSDVIVDPGFGFGKSIDHNYKLLKNLKSFEILDCLVLAGVSRKSMINKVLEISPEEALNGTSVLNTIALMNGANILRVHDVKEAKEAIQLFDKMNQN